MSLAAGNPLSSIMPAPVRLRRLDRLATDQRGARTLRAGLPIEIEDQCDVLNGTQQQVTLELAEPPIDGLAWWKVVTLLGLAAFRVNKLKYFRTVTARLDKRHYNFLASVQLASIRIWLRHNEAMSRLSSRKSSGPDQSFSQLTLTLVHCVVRLQQLNMDA